LQSADTDAGHRALRPPARGRAIDSRFLVARSHLPLRRRHLPAARHVVRGARRRAHARAPRLLRLGLDRAAGAARRAQMARSLQARDDAARQLDLARRDRAQARPPIGHSAASRACRGQPMKLTLIKPTIGRMTHSLYVDEARMEPLNLGVLAALTPENVD